MMHVATTLYLNDDNLYRDFRASDSLLLLSLSWLRPASEPPGYLARMAQLDSKVVGHLPHQPGVLLEHAPVQDDIRAALVHKPL